MSKLLSYNHPAISTKYKTGQYYSLDRLKEDLTEDKIKELFKPVNFEWEAKRIEQPESKKIEQTEKIKSPERKNRGKLF